MAVVHKTLLCVVGLLLAGAGCSDGPAPGRALGSESNGMDDVTLAIWKDGVMAVAVQIGDFSVHGV